MDMAVGTFAVATTQNRGHSPEFYADRIVDRLISVSETAPEPIKAQALVYRESMRAIILDGIKRAILSDRTTLAGRMNQFGMGEAAVFVTAINP